LAFPTLPPSITPSPAGSPERPPSIAKKIFFFIFLTKQDRIIAVQLISRYFIPFGFWAQLNNSGVTLLSAGFCNSVPDYD
jgi:hypothetical protein